MQKKIVCIVTCCIFVVLISASGICGETKEEGKPAEGEMIGVELPKIDEIFGQASKAGIIGDWEKRIKVKGQDYGAMPEPRRAFEVGKTLADIAFLAIDRKEGKEISPDVLDKAEEAIRSLNPPSDIEEKLVKLKGGVKANTLKGEKLRKEIDALIKEFIPKIAKAPKIKDAGTMVWASGFCRAMYLGTSTVAGYDKPDEAQLSMFRYGSMIDYFIEYFSEKAKDSFKKDTVVKNLVITMKKLKPVVEKKPDKFTKEDVVKLSKLLEGEFK